MVNMRELGKIPPQAIDFEKAVLGAVMLESTAYIEICDIISHESFYVDAHSKIYAAIKNVYLANNPIDFLTVMEQLRIDKNLESAGGISFLTGLTESIGSSSHIEFHARVIQQKYIQRELIRISINIQNKAFDESIDVSDLLNYSESELFGITQGNLKKEPKHIGIIGKEQLRLLEETNISDNDFLGIPTGLPALDRLMNGLQNKKLIIIAARPAMGKTTLVISLARNVALDFDKKVAIFTLEMGEDEIWSKLISDITDIQYAKLVGGKIDDSSWPLVEHAQAKLEDSKIFVDDTAGITLFELRAKARRLKIKHEIDIIFIDYLQLMSGDANSGNREQEISKISRGLKVMSKDLNIPIVCLSQLNRSVENRPDKKPQLSDLRESGAIEQDADMVMFIYRPEEYGFETYEDGQSTINKVDILIRKNRGGKTGDVNLDRTSGFTRIYDKSAEYVDVIKPLDNSELEANSNF